ncbi:MAG: LamG-like jellyroll fold domain-containing protein [Victivallaceae bacterium]
MADNPDLAGCWNFDGNLLDLSGNNNPGTVSGTAAYNDGKAGQSFDFNGNTYIDCGANPGLSIADNISLELWFYPKQWSTGYAAYPVNKRSGTGDANYVMYFFGDTSGSMYKRVGFYANADGTWKNASPTCLIPALDAWYHIVWTYNSTSGGSLYVNGVSQGLPTGTGALTTNTASLKIGTGFNGLIDEVKIYNRVLTPEEVAQKSGFKMAAAVFNPGKWDAEWILPADKNIRDKARFSKEFELKEIPRWANVSIAAESYSSILINGKQVGRTSSWIDPKAFNISSLLRIGRNMIEADVTSAKKQPALMCEVVLWNNAGKCRKIISDSSWSAVSDDKKSKSRPAPFVTPQAGPVWGPLGYIYGGPLPDVKVIEHKSPERKSYGEALEVSISFSGNPVEYGAEWVELLFKTEGKVVRTLKPCTTGGNSFVYRIPAVPSWMPSGKYTLNWRRAGTSEEPRVFASMEISGEIPPSCCAEVKEYNGRPRLHINGTPLPFLGMLTRNPRYLSVEHKDMGEAGRHLQFAISYLDWNKECDYNVFDEQIYAVLNADPEANVMIWLGIYAPDWWKQQHPEELIKFADSTIDDRTGQGRTLYDASMASTLFRQEASNALTALARHILSKPYRSRIFGFMFSGATTGEWIWLGSITPMPAFSDYSVPMRKYFQSYLQSKYQSDVKALQTAWNQPDVNFTTAEPPAKQLWLDETSQAKAPFHVNRQILDYATAHSEVMADIIAAFARVIRGESSNKWITGAYYGYHLYLPRHTYLAMTGHLAMGKLLRNPDIQLLDSPYTYYKRGPGGDGMPMTGGLESVRLHGKLWISENDVRTHLAVDAQEALNARCLTEDDTLQVLRRDFALSLIRGFGSYWFSIAQPTRPWFAGKLFIDRAKEFQKIADEDLTRQFKSDARVAVIIDEESPKCVHPAYNILKPLLQEQFCANMNSVGVPWDCYLSSDLEKIAGQYDVFVFANLFYLSKPLRKIIDSELKKKGKTIIWCYAPGGAHLENTLEYMSGLTGLDNIKENASGKPSIKFDGSKESIAWTEGIPALPTFYSEDKTAKALGKYENGKIAILSKELDGWKSIFIGALYLPPSGWRTIFREAGLSPIMDTDDVVYFRSPWFASHTRDGGRKTANLPSEWKEAVDIYHDKHYLIENGKLRWDANPNTTYLFKKK